MPTNVEADIEVQRFGFGDRKLTFPHAHTHKIEGRSGGVTYGAADCTFEALEGRLDTLRWSAEAASVGSAWLRDDAGRFDLQVQRAEMPHGIMLMRGSSGIELISPHVTLSEVKISAKGPFGRSKPATPPAAPLPPKPLRQERWRFLDSLSGRIYLTIKVQLDLPVVGVRTLDQQLRIPVQEGSLDYRALEESLDWLEGAFLDIKHDGNRLWVQWKVPIVGGSHELISWPLDTDAATLASFGRVPVRSLTDFRLPASGPPKQNGKKNKLLQAFTVDAIDVALSLLAPRHVEVGTGVILFGGEDQPGMVDLKVTGAIRDRGPGALRGAIGSVDTTIKDLRLGSIGLTADRLHFDGLDQLEVTFDGFTPTAVSVIVHRVTATNLALTIGSSPPASPSGQSPPR